MRLFYSISLLFILFLNVHGYGYMISRGKFIRNNVIHFSLNKDKLFSVDENKNALVISCDKIGKRVLEDLNNINIKTSVTTTKPKRFDELSKMANEVIIIPQMEIGSDNVLREVVMNNDVIIIADTISIFSVHTFLSTCKRIANAIKEKRYNKKTTVILISSVNVYGVHTDGAFVNEESSINVIYNRDNSKQWQLNHYAIANIMKLAEDYILRLANARTVVLRTSTIWDDSNIDEFRNNKDLILPKLIGNSYMSLGFTDEISNCIKWVLENKEVNGCFNLVSNSIKRRDFYDNLADIIKKPRIKWVDGGSINQDFFYSMDKNPLLPNTQRFNMRVVCNKIKKKGYQFKYSI